MKSQAAESEKSKKYDRQIRLWGEHGQAALESAHVCLINATATGTEVLKSVILPGVGAFTIVDGNTVTGEDVGSNFFLDSASIGKPRAQAATLLLMELNPDVQGDFVEETAENLLEHNPTYFSNFTVVIATALQEKTLLTLAAKLWDAGVPLVVCRSYGFIGYIRLQVGEHPVMETHPDNVLDDLRLDRPFPALRAFVDSINMETLTDKEHSHTPYVVILLKALDEWQQQNGSQTLPKNSREKDALKQLISKKVRAKENRSSEPEENFEEAVKAVNRSLNATVVPREVKELFEDEACLTITAESKPFWVMMRALKEFVENEGGGALPVRGTLPDMTSDTERYVKLLNIYRAEAEKDVQAVYRRVQQLLNTIGKPEDFITEADVKLLCKNAHAVRLVRGRSLAAEYDAKEAKVHTILTSLDSPDSEIIFYVLFRAVDRFYSQYNCYPGYFDDQLETDISKLKTSLGQVLQEWGSGPIARDDYVHEMCRYGAAELHAVAAFVGACAAHEVIKLATGQYVPLNNTLIYNAMTAASETFVL